MAISHCYWHLVVKNGNFTLLLTSSGQEWQFHTFKNGYIAMSSGPEWQCHIATDVQWSRMAISHCYWHLVVKNGNFTLLLITSSGPGMAISHCYWHLVVRMAISHCYWHLVVKNGKFTLLLTSSGQEWQFHTATDIYWSRMAISHCYWCPVVKNGNFTLLLTSTSPEWQFHIATDI